ncbi:MAG: XRE family transcriptional regulator [Halobacteriovoraceae bacterium]|nr:XRE family transcriptional regulator [Halobacteriovoraceae bacterium]
MKTITTKTSNDLAKALGLSESDAVEWDVRQSLTEQIIQMVKKKSLTVTQLAQYSQTSRARITKILKGDTTGISIDVLLRVLVATGQKVTLSYKKIA